MISFTKKDLNGETPFDIGKRVGNEITKDFILEKEYIIKNYQEKFSQNQLLHSPKIPRKPSSEPDMEHKEEYIVDVHNPKGVLIERRTSVGSIELGSIGKPIESLVVPEDPQYDLKAHAVSTKKRKRVMKTLG